MSFSVFLFFVSLTKPSVPTLCQAERAQITQCNSNNYVCICLLLGDSHTVIQLCDFWWQMKHQMLLRWNGSKQNSFIYFKLGQQGKQHTEMFWAIGRKGVDALVLFHINHLVLLRTSNTATRTTQQNFLLRPPILKLMEGNPCLTYFTKR